jgi:putative GTP pyrophosphokinase
MDSLQTFLYENRIDAKTWQTADIKWEVLQAIAEDHGASKEALQSAAELLARVIQRFASVHSVRWRVKDGDHLLKKIVRKRAEGLEKYRELTPANYFELVTDLVGVRALHLFKNECFAIGHSISRTWTLAEPPLAYIREGDPPTLTEDFKANGWDVKNHPEGYRSVHYVVSTKPLQRTVLAEVQVRTIFEEGWSEIDHRVRYPDFSDDQQVAYFLRIFNGLAGSADEMGAFVQGLVASVSSSAQAISEERRGKAEALGRLEALLADFDKTKKQDAAAQAKIKALQEEVTKLKAIEPSDYRFASGYTPGLSSLFSGGSQALPGTDWLIPEPKK